MSIITKILNKIKENREKRLAAMGISPKVRRAMTPYEVELLWYKEKERRDKIKAEALKYRQQYNQEAIFGRGLKPPLKRNNSILRKKPLSGDMSGFWQA